MDFEAETAMPSERDVTRALARVNEGEPEAAADLLPLVYDELRALAAAFLRRERANHTLQPTALVHEAYLRMVDQREANWTSRAHFMAIASQVIRRILIDHARRHRAAKRQTPGAITVDVADAQSPMHAEIDLLALDEALERLAGLSERQARVVELRFFGGLSVEEAAHVLDVSPNTVKGDWRLARAWLQQTLETPNEH